MPADPFDELRAPTVVVQPRRAFAADLRRRLATELGLDPTTGEDLMTTTTTTATTTAASVRAYLIVPDSRRAIAWYGDVFGAVLSYEPVVMDDGRVGHCEITIGATSLQMADEFPEIGAVAPDPARASVSFTIEVADVDAVHAAAVRHGATSVREPDDQFYGLRAGDVVDPFGHRWTIQGPLRGDAPPAR